MKAATYQIDEEGILDSTFNYLVKHGLENITIRELCKGTGIAQGSIYYWFSGKQDLICEAAEYGLRKVVDKIFSYVFSNMKNLRKFFDECLSEINKYKNELRFIYQMAASPVYGGKIRGKGQDLNIIYDKYVEMLALRLQCSTQKLKPLVYLFISAVLDYVVWEDTENTQMQLEFIYSVFNGTINTYKAKDNTVNVS
ncbi:MAG: TetR/AcrR family transcriptional regulator [Eubacterium sp.]